MHTGCLHIVHTGRVMGQAKPQRILGRFIIQADDPFFHQMAAFSQLKQVKKRLNKVKEIESGKCQAFRTSSACKNLGNRRVLIFLTLPHAKQACAFGFGVQQ